LDDAERRRRIVDAYNMALSELRSRHYDEFQMLNEFYREYLQMPRTTRRPRRRETRPAAPTSTTSTRKG